MGYLLVFLTLLAAVPLSGCAESNDASTGGIPRFQSVANELYRGGQPTEKGFEFLKAKGVKTIINLRAEENDEAQIVQQLGMNYVRIPVDEVRPWTRIPDAAIAKYFEIINNPKNYPIFFHCTRGADRTGAMAAMYRVGVQGWDAQKAYDEARDIGMRWFYSGLKTQIYNFHHPALRTDLQPTITNRDGAPAPVADRP